MPTTATTQSPLNLIASIRVAVGDIEGKLNDQQLVDAITKLRFDNATLQRENTLMMHTLEAQAIIGSYGGNQVVAKSAAETLVKVGKWVRTKPE